MATNPNLKGYKLPDVPSLKVHGRTTGRLTPLTLFWTGSAVELNVSGSELWIEVEVDYSQHEQWICIVINSVPVARQMLTSGRYWICVFRGMNESTIKNVRVVKEVQAMNADPEALLQIHAVRSDGRFEPVIDRPWKLEFIGDSITSGEGAIGAVEETDWIPMWFSAIRSYSIMTAEALNADYRILSQSGWGVRSSWDNNPKANIPDYYEQVCGLLTGERNRELGAQEQNDFNTWQPDVVIVNLGTNDGSAFHSPEWRDENGTVHKQRLNADGTYHEEDLKAFEQAVEQFLVKLRKNNKHAHLVWAYGMLGTPMMPAIYRAVDTYRSQSGDHKVSIFQLPNMTEATMGARSHPGTLAHEAAAGALTGYIEGILLHS
ncbi:SGNH/GDSL hydrolase family protein [Neobacillus mesonae]|nr:SGNH/GDSL hydrolase family protein [Neobacillus mesonae]